MIYKIEIENFYSICDRQTLDLRVPKNAPSDCHRLARCWRGSVDRAPKVVAVFGANGSGKSNLLRALSFTAWFVGSSFSLSPGARIPYEPFNDRTSFELPTRLRFWFSAREDPGAVNSQGAVECPYSYELSIGNGRNGRVIGEGISYWPTATGRRTRLIERFENGTVRAAKVFGLSGYKNALEKVLRPNASVISTLAQLNHPIAVKMAKTAQGTQSNILVEKLELAEDLVLRTYIENPEMVERLNREIRRIDVGVRSLEIVRGNDGPQVFFRHEGLAVPMPAVYESHGTRQFLKLFPLIMFSLLTGGIVIIDELDAAIHPMILPEIIRWFHDPVRNPYDAQLWMTCHNVSLLEDLWKDEIVFCEKDTQGRTETFCLNDIKGIRRNDNYYKKYLGGVLGAVPRIG